MIPFLSPILQIIASALGLGEWYAKKYGEPKNEQAREINDLKAKIEEFKKAEATDDIKKIQSDLSNNIND